MFSPASCGASIRTRLVDSSACAVAYPDSTLPYRDVTSPLQRHSTSPNTSHSCFPNIYPPPPDCGSGVFSEWWYLYDPQVIPVYLYTCMTRSSCSKRYGCCLECVPPVVKLLEDSNRTLFKRVVNNANHTQHRKPAPLLTIIPELRGEQQPHCKYNPQDSLSLGT